MILTFRIKPDIIAPGAEIESAKSNGNGDPSCQLTIKSGIHIMF